MDAITSKTSRYVEGIIKIGRKFVIITFPMPLGFVIVLLMMPVIIIDFMKKIVASFCNCFPVVIKSFYWSPDQKILI